MLNCARDRVTRGELRQAGVKTEAQSVTTFPSKQQRNQPVALAAVMRSMIHLASSPSNGSLLSSEPVVVGVSPDLSAPTMTGGVESSTIVPWFHPQPHFRFPAAFVGEGVVGSLC